MANLFRDNSGNYKKLPPDTDPFSIYNYKTGYGDGELTFNEKTRLIDEYNTAMGMFI